MRLSSHGKDLGIQASNVVGGWIWICRSPRSVDGIRSGNFPDRWRSKRRSRTPKSTQIYRGIWNTINTHYRLTRNRHNHVIGTKIACTNFSLPNRLRYRHYNIYNIAHHVTCTPKSRLMPITNYDVIKYADVTDHWGIIIVLDGGFSPFSAPMHRRRRIFSTLKHGVASLSRRGNLNRNWSFKLVARSSVECFGLHLYLEFERRLEYNELTQRRRECVR